ncbi:hypothetical protein FRB97_004262 [Tulasnella sp. 331]|nr:hypothetical protein FRB97_004262 [Tulasnella sp. 331]
MEAAPSNTYKLGDVEDCTHRDNASDTSNCDSSRGDDTRLLIHGPPASPIGRSCDGDILAPIDQLPFELLSYIILLHLNSLQCVLWRSGIPWRVKDLTKVSKWWREVIINTAAMWTYIQAGMSPSEVGLVLERSKEGPLDLECDRYRRDNFKGLLCDVSPQIGRWRSLRLDLPIISSGLLSCLSQRTPGLEAIYIRSSEGLSRIEDLGEGHHFRSVEVSKVALPWHSERFAGLCHLHIDSLDNFGPTTQEMIAMLTSSPQLKSLHLEQMEFMGDVRERGLPSSDSGGDMTPIHLPNLTHLLIKCIPPDAYNSIVSRVRCPASQSVILKPREDVDLFDHAAPSFIHQFQHLLRNDEHVHLQVRERHAIMRTHDMWKHRPRGIHPKDGFYLRMRVPEGPTQPGERLAWQHMADVVKAVCPVDVLIELRISSSASRRWDASLVGHFAGIQQLTWIIDSSTSPVEAVRVLAHLAKPIQSGGWPCPHLRHIDLGSIPVSSEYMLKSVKGRWEEYKQEQKGEGSDDQRQDLVEILWFGEQRSVWRPTYQIEREMSRK